MTYIRNMAPGMTVLDHRLAEGHISVEEYEQRKKTLSASSS